jgi:predicted ribosome quality control (RQC) complex YloA/Tae2 family protein
VERVFVPESVIHPEGFQKRTLVIELYQRSQSFQLYLSLRSGECGILIYPQKTLKPAARAPKSGFELSLSKHLPGSALRSVHQVPGDRVVVLEFESHSRFTLSFHLIPGKPLGVLLEKGQLLQSTDQRETYTLPATRPLQDGDLQKIPLHPEWLPSIEHYAGLWRNAESQSLLKLRLQHSHKKWASDLHSLEHKIKSLGEQLTQTEKEEDWARFGVLLQTHLHERPVAKQGYFELLDYETGESVRLIANPKLSLEEQLNRYFHQAKRKKKRLLETEDRLRELREKQARILDLKQKFDLAETLSDLTKIESDLGMSLTQGAPTPKKEEKKIGDFSGRIYRSKEGLLILSGRNLSENLMVTFKIARGNDLWLHVKGRPGSHTVILLPPNRTASLDTLLDAAHLCILHSGGKDWGKTDVDYTFRKNVKKIKNQTEVSYTQNKTLSVTLDEVRVKRLSET